VVSGLGVIRLLDSYGLWDRGCGVGFTSINGLAG
jgi:hypothetical protein